MMTQAFYTGISGLQSFQTGIDSVSDNLANISTVGFRGYNTEFSSLFEKAQNTGSDLSNSVGVGVQVQANSMNKELGDMMLSDRSTDLAIMGNGWFGITNQEDLLYTRAGDFTFDRDNDLVTMDGMYVLGTMGDNISDGVLTGTLDDIPLGNIATQEKLRFPKTLNYPAQPTSTAIFMDNIGLEEATAVVGIGVIDPQNNKNNLRLNFTKIVPQETLGSQWEVTATTQTLNGDTIYDTQVGRVDFDERGALISSTIGSIDNNGASVAIDLGTGFSGVVAIRNSPVNVSGTADGTPEGELVGYAIDQNAQVIATFSNGMQSSVGKIAVYHFGNEQGLERQTGTRFSQSSNSGDALFYQDADGQNVIGTTVANFKLEASNVRMDVGLTDLIIFQRAYDANSKSITTADEMMQKALSMDA